MHVWLESTGTYHSMVFALDLPLEAAPGGGGEALQKHEHVDTNRYKKHTYQRGGWVSWMTAKQEAQSPHHCHQHWQLYSGEAENLMGGQI